ncbi:MAG: alpha/beta hydrolase [Succinivibrio sp.]|nr:alpha/beta hydrolase [Succinivibrio sp.]
MLLACLLTACPLSGLASELCYFTQGSKAAPSSIPYGNNPEQGHYVTAEDAKLYYEVYGEGSPVYVLHGGGVGTPFEMGALIDYLRAQHQVIVLSSRGHGRSQIGHSALTFEGKAEDVLAVFRQMGTDKAILVGFSDGAYTALKFASLYPDKVDRVIAIGAGTLRKGFFSGELNLDELEKIDSRFVQQQLKIRPEPERWQEFASAYMRFWSQMEVGAELFGSILAPVLLIVGDEDDHAPVKTVLEAHQLLQNSRLCVVPHAWHTAFLDNFEVVRAAIADFLSKSAAQTSGSKKLSANN